MTTVQLPSSESLIVQAVRNLAVDSGVVTSPVPIGGNVIADTSKTWATDIHRNRLVKVISRGYSQQALIGGNEFDALRIVGAWARPITPGDTYVILGMDFTQAMIDALAGGAGGTSTGSLAPIDKAVLHNVAVVAAANILGAVLAPTNTPCLFRVTAGFDTSGVLSVTVTRAGNTQVQQFNGGVALNNNSLYMFDALVHAGDTINYRYSVNATLQTFRVQEIVAATQ